MRGAALDDLGHPAHRRQADPAGWLGDGRRGEHALRGPDGLRDGLIGGGAVGRPRRAQGGVVELVHETGRLQVQRQLFQVGHVAVEDARERRDGQALGLNGVARLGQRVFDFRRELAGIGNAVIGQRETRIDKVRDGADIHERYPGAPARDNRGAPGECTHSGGGWQPGGRAESRKQEAGESREKARRRDRQKGACG